MSSDHYSQQNIHRHIEQLIHSTSPLLLFNVNTYLHHIDVIVGCEQRKAQISVQVSYISYGPCTFCRRGTNNKKKKSGKCSHITKLFPRTRRETAYNVLRENVGWKAVLPRGKAQIFDTCLIQLQSCPFICKPE